MTPLTPADPHHIGGYWLAGRLGAGGQGVVYEAYGPAGEHVAVKVPRFDSTEARARLAKEAAAARRVASFCTAKVIEVQTAEPAPYIVSEFVPGPNLRQVVTESGPYEGDRLHRLAVGVATALMAIHQVGIVHRDLKPDNIILGPDGPRVIDFGVAREAGPTTSGAVIGTPGYMSPEVLAGRGATEAADLWAWGMVVLFAATGKNAIEADDPMSVVTRVLDFRPDTGGLPGPLDRLVAAALDRDPAKRPAAGAVLLRLLGGEQGDLLSRGGTLAATLKEAPAGPDLGAVAEELYAELTEAERASVPEVFLRMIDGDSLRPVARDELPETEAIDALLAVFAAAGLVTRDGDSYELASPGLVQAWPRLREWLAANRDGLTVHRRLADAAAQWDQHGRKPADLLHGSHLDRTLQWAATERKDLTLARREREFLEAASRQARRQSRRRGLLAAALAVLLVAALGGFGLAEYLRRESNRQRDDALARELTLRAADLRQTVPPLARLLTVAAWRLSPSLPETRGALYDSLSQPTTDAFTDPYFEQHTLYALSLDGRTLASVSASGGTARIWDVPGRREIRRLSGLGDGASKAALSPDGAMLALQDEHGVRLWDTGTGRQLGERFAQDVGEPVITQTLAFDTTGRLLQVPKDSSSDSVQMWDVSTRRRLTTPSGSGLFAVSPDGRYGYVSDGRTDAQLWDLRAGKRLPTSDLPGQGVTIKAVFSPDGRSLATVEDIGAGHLTRTRVYDLPSGTRQLTREGGPGASVDFAFGDRYVALWGWDGELEIMRRADHDTVFQRKLPSEVRDLRFDLPGRAIRFMNDSGTVYTLDVSTLFDAPASGSSGPDTAMLDPSARVVAAMSGDTLITREAATGRRLAGPMTWRGTSPAMAFSPDGRRLAYGDDDTVHVIETVSGRVSAKFTLAAEGAAEVTGMAFSPDGRTLAISSWDQGGTPPRDPPVELRDLERGSSTLVTGSHGDSAMAFRPDGRLLLAGTPPELIDPVNAVTRPPGSGLDRLDGAFAFSPDSRQVAFSGLDGISVWNGDLSAKLAELPPGPGGEVERLAWSPDGRTLAAYERGMRVRLWDVPTRQMLGVVFDGLLSPEYGETGSLVFSADGGKLYNAAPDGTVRTHELGGERVAGEVCERAGRTLTAAEWERYLPGIEPFDLCPGSQRSGSGIQSVRPSPFLNGSSAPTPKAQHQASKRQPYRAEDTTWLTFPPGPSRSGSARQTRRTCGAARLDDRGITS
ncbi:protein kinase domain-containing protein [Nonomuraea jabiensis]|uniref:protein kinase domain-containing protein n=1 Tax=Nonomuraea jabiensis TaxID=882448 RepID=UPI003D715F7F